jgi:hypothetical protein
VFFVCGLKGDDTKGEAVEATDTLMPELNPHTNSFERHQSGLQLSAIGEEGDGKQRQITTTAALLENHLLGEQGTGAWVFHKPPAVLMLQVP